MKAKPFDLSIVTAAQRKRFDEKIDRSGDGCWLWTAGTRTGGYGRIGVGSLKSGFRVVSTHRLAWMLAHPFHALGPDDCVLHRCDVRNCCRPNHLFLGTKAQNTRDMDMKGRRIILYGETNGGARLTVYDVKVIRSSDDLLRVLAARYGVAMSTISIIRRREAWRHVKGETGEICDRRRGEFGHCARLTVSDVKTIRSSNEGGVSLAVRFGVSRATISRVRLRQSWRYVT